MALKYNNMTIDVEEDGAVRVYWYGRTYGDGMQEVIKKEKYKTLKSFFNKHKRALK